MLWHLLICLYKVGSIIFVLSVMDFQLEAIMHFQVQTIFKR